MKTLKLTVLLWFVLTSSVWGSSFPTKGNSHYGSVGLNASTFCLNADGSEASNQSDCALAPITEQTFSSPSSQPNFVFDYTINSMSSYVFTLTNSTDEFLDFGAFIPGPGTIDCAGDTVSQVNPEPTETNCGPDPNSLPTVPTVSPALTFDSSTGMLTSPVSEVSVDVKTGGKGLVFFVLEAGTVDPITGQPDPPSTSPDVNLSPLTSTVPEPGSWVLLASVMLLLVGFGGRRLRVGPYGKT